MRVRRAGRELDGCRTVVTGGAGFIGSHVATALANAGAAVVVADNLRTGLPGNLSALNGNVRIRQADLCSADLAPILRGTDLVVHCAASAYVPPSVERPLEDFEINLGLSLRLLEWLRLNAPQTSIVLFSSAAIYGNPRYSPVDEDHPLDPISPYGVSKLSAERYAAVYARLYGMPITSLRCFAVYGPRQRKQVIFDVMQRMRAGNGVVQVLGDGSQIRDFCFVEDVAGAVLTVVEQAPMQGEAWNVGSGTGVTVRELVDAIGSALDVAPRASYTGKIRPGDPEVVIADNRRLRSLGWIPQVELRDGLRATAEWLVGAEPVLVG